MATEEFFVNQIGRLFKQFGRRYYSDERVALIWNEVCYLPNVYLMDLFGDFIADARCPPTRKDFREAIKADKIFAEYAREKMEKSSRRVNGKREETLPPETRNPRNTREPECRDPDEQNGMQ